MTIDPAALSALISGISAIIVAIINCYATISIKIPSARKKTSKEKKKSYLRKIDRNEKIWILFIIILIPWLLLSSQVWSGYMSLYNLVFIVPILTVVFAKVIPIKPLSAIIAVLALHPITLFITSDVPLWLRFVDKTIPSAVDKPTQDIITIIFIDWNGIIFIISIIVINVIFVYYICQKQRGKIGNKSAEELSLNIK